MSNETSKSEAVVNAGSMAYHMLIPIHSNPHKQQPFHDLWDKGWRQARVKFEGYPKKGNRPERGRQGKPLLSDKRADNFNRRHRTAL